MPLTLSVALADGSAAASVDLPDGATVAQLRAAIAAKLGVPAERQLLTVDDTPLPDDAASLSAAGVTGDSLVMVVDFGVDAAPPAAPRAPAPAPPAAGVAAGASGALGALAGGGAGAGGASAFMDNSGSAVELPGTTLADLGNVSPDQLHAILAVNVRCRPIASARARARTPCSRRPTLTQAPPAAAPDARVRGDQRRPRRGRA